MSIASAWQILGAQVLSFNRAVSQEEPIGLCLMFAPVHIYYPRIRIVLLCLQPEPPLVRVSVHIACWAQQSWKACCLQSACKGR